MVGKKGFRSRYSRKAKRTTNPYKRAYYAGLKAGKRIARSRRTSKRRW